MDGNKRTALTTTTVCYLLNEYRFDYDDEIREILKLFETDETTVDEHSVLEYLQNRTAKVDLSEVVEQWRDGLVANGLDHLADDGSDPNE